MRAWSACFSLLALTLGAAGASCGDDSAQKDGGGPDVCTAHQVPASTDLTTPKVSFANDVAPIFARSCALGGATCHGTPKGATGIVFLGLVDGGVPASTIRSGLVGVLTSVLHSMSYVTPGDPSQSFLMHKMDGDQCLFDSQCVGKYCGMLMPQTADTPLEVDTRDTVRRWIVQGALDN
jgi:hypothetical protein